MKIKYNIRHLIAFLSILIITPIGFAAKFYNGPGAWWFNNYFAGAVYEIFWCLAAYLLWQRNSPFIIVMVVFLATVFLEFLQLWHPDFLELIRSTFIGRTLIGTSFSWWDIPHYFMGCLMGWFWIKIIQKINVRGI